MITERYHICSCLIYQANTLPDKSGNYKTMEQNPFAYGVEVSGSAFWDRENESRELKKELSNSQNVVIFSKRRMGKTSLIKEVLRELPQNKFITACIDLYPTASVEDFALRYAMGVSSAIKGPVNKILAEAKAIFRSFTPMLTLDDEGKPVLTIDFGRNIKQQALLDEVLEAFPAYCAKKGKPGVLVLDEFQQIGTYDKERKLEATLRSHYQTHKNISYVFLGSKKHLLTEIFNSPNRPFYHSAMMFPLKEMDTSVMTDCVIRRFEDSGCKVERSEAEYLIEQADRHPYYTQRIAHVVWNSAISGKRDVTKAEVDAAIKRIIDENSDYFRSLCELLTQHQLNALKVAAHINGEKVFSKDFLSRHNWQKDSLKQALDALVDKDILSREENIYKIDDVFFRRWLLLK